MGHHGKEFNTSPVRGVVSSHSAAELEEYCHDIPSVFMTTQKGKIRRLLNFYAIPNKKRIV